MNIPVIPADVPAEKRIEWLTKNLDKFCVLPWLNLNTNPNGNIKLCCNIQIDHWVSDGVPYNLGKHDIDVIWYSHYMKNARKMHRSNLGSVECADCYNMEKVSGHSPRVGQNDMWTERQADDKSLEKYLKDVSSEEPLIRPKQLPTSLELRLGNKCNLKCITCWGMSSSLIHEERTEYLKNNLLDVPALKWLEADWENEKQLVDNTDVSEWFETDIFYNNFKKMAPTLKRLYTTGGEPTVIKANYKMLQFLLEAGNDTCRIEFTSNMTNWNPLFYDNLSKFKNVEIQMSIDGVDEIGEYIRYPSNFSKVRENLFKAVEIASRNPGWKIKCYTVLQALNYKHLAPIWNLLNEAGVKYNKSIDWWPITLYSPSFLSLACVPLEIRKECIPTLIKESELFKNSNDGRFYLSEGTLGACKDSILNMEYQPTLQERLDAYIIFTDKQRSANSQKINFVKKNG